MNKSIIADFQDKINFACHQNDIAILRKLYLYNATETNWENVKITMSTSPNFTNEKIWNIEKVEAGEKKEIKDRLIEINADFLLSIKEAMTGQVTFKLEVNGEIIEEEKKDIQLLAYNEWGGSNYIPELLSAFVMPNSQGVDCILGETGALLKEKGKDGILNGYEDKSSAKVWDMISALYSVIAKKGITYCLPPASFEKNGQKIRLVEDILRDKVATCLDITLLFASCIEQMGLYPIIVILKGHAFVGAWLKPCSFEDVIIDNSEALRKRIDLKEIIIFESVVVTNSTIPNFTYAQKLAEDKLLYGQDFDFELMIDVHVARLRQLRPLALKSNQYLNYECDKTTETQTNLGFETAPEDLPDFEEDVIEEEITNENRLNIWQKKLLNLSPSNPLLNCRISQTNLAILCPNPAKLEDAIADGEKISLVSAEKILNTRIDPTLRALRTGENLWVEQATQALEAKQLLVNVPEAKLQSQLVALYRKTKTLLEEGGSNTLYLAIGFLNWRKKEKSKQEKIYHAPLILLPVKLERASIKSGVKLQAHEDESRFNTTLLQMLKQDFEISIPSLEGELPTDNSGLNVVEIWNRVRKAVKEVDGFEVVEEVVLGHFSFNKYLMWKDLVDRTDEVMKHPFVASLINKDLPQIEVGEFVDAKDLDTNYKPQDLFVPMPSDSSQLAVIAGADSGKSFVMEGPPGTGKSQTITNLIAHLMAKGKTVLFVSEKMAALEVVYRRLEQIGLGKFCLELHSNKANKKEVLKQLKASWDSASVKSNEEWEKTAFEILRLRQELNTFIAELHKKGQQGLTPYYAIGMCARYERIAQLVQFSWNNINQHTQEEYLALKDVAHKLQIQANQCENLFKSKAFALVTNSEWAPKWQKELVNASKELSQQADILVNVSQNCIEQLGINIEEKTSVENIKNIHHLTQILKNNSLNKANFALERNGLEKIEALETSINHLTSYIKAKESLSCNCPKDIWEKIDPDELLKTWKEAEEKWFLPKFMDELSIKQIMKKAGAKGKILLPEDIKNIKILRENGLALKDLDSTLRDVKVWKIENSKLEDVEASIKIARNLRDITSKLAKTPEEVKTIREKIDVLINENRELLSQSSSLVEKINQLEKEYKSFEELYKKFKSLCNSTNADNYTLEKIYSLTTDEIKQISIELEQKEGNLKDWCYWQSLKKEAIQNELSSYIKSIENNQIEIKDIEIAFEVGYCEWWIQCVMNENKILREFSSIQHTDKINRFREYDDKFRELTSEYITSILSRNIPNKETTSLNNEWKVLQREMQKQRQIKPVRQLLKDCPNAVKTLAPCMMMSPLSVAQYLPVSKDAFDVIVFDEASQITVWDAIGTLSRGNQIIVAGDPKQMPPSNFFGRTIDYNEEELGLDEDLESILDELIGSGIPTLSLNWHYRSRCESLIAFSNDRYYEGNLVTFPSSKTNQKSVFLREVKNGVYQRGARINKIEAQEVVKECVSRLTSKDENVRNKSIGIVTFNSDQQKLIEDMLDEQRHLHPEIEFAFNPDNPDSVFVKNLETVQGDERDVILFSVTYGADDSGKLSMNFGPLNRVGGERRLNVAFTRAKHEMVIFSSLNAEQIDLNRTKSQGVADLKGFLHYAQIGKEALGSFVTNSSKEFNTPFEQEVAKCLREKGWLVHSQVGASSYRIDLAVVHPNKEDTYLAGIECDGQAYYNCLTARDRDKSRESVLSNLGWNILKVWSLDWWTNKEGSIEAIHNKLLELHKKDKTYIAH